ncbi:hypothetical protein EVG20_g8917 [Dentipellis fragilis]|uniref:Rab-GAP TBC domain-containing protein n=1 Tax=Dentipellis fragilis TaxID=205917 RepID=A0A4Y9Y2I3_9AGAM|nr:hypothetical protein EVG20_g8917 [Dentipellis fragilis]
MWDPTRVKAQFRLSAQRLGQIRDRKDAEGQLVGRDITTLLQQGNVMLARAKAQKLIHDDVLGDVFEILEMQIGVLLERFGELDSGSPGPAIIEAAATIVYATPQIGIKDLQGVRDLLGHRLGLEFVRSSIANRDNHVSLKVVRALSAPPVSASDMNSYLMNIAKSYGYKWVPDFMPDEILNIISELLDKTNASPVVDMPRLRKVCAHGIPDDPCWLRPRTWRLLLGTLPVLKASWDNEARKQRENYYDLVRRLLDPYASLPPPTDPLGPLDTSLMEAIKDLFRVPPNLFAGLEEEPEAFTSCPVDTTASDDVKIRCASALDHRLQLIHARDADNSSQTTPEIRIQDDADSNPEISVTSPNSTASPGLNGSITLYPSKAFKTAGAHPKHAAALVRLLYIHSCLNPAHKSPHMASLLIPLYSVLSQEIEPHDLAHVEADTFWAFEAMVSEFAELEDEEGGNQWMQKFSQRLQWADIELYNDMHTKGLDPALPHYSYRWLAPILTHTLPLPAVLSVWDALFSCPMTTRDSCPKLEHLIDICTSMLLRAKAPIIRLGKSGHHTPGLWGEENVDLPPPSPVRSWELSDAFIEGMTLLQLYPVAAAGGIESILLTAAELSGRREVEAARPKTINESLGNRLRDTVWRGFTNQAASPLSSPDTSDSEEGSLDDGIAVPSPALQISQSPNLTARLAGAVWKGITNQSAMEVPHSPVSPVSPLLLPLSASVTYPNPAVPPSPTPSTSSLWSYAERLKDSDAAATLAKVSTNWRVRAIQAWTNTNAVDQHPHGNTYLSVAAKPRSGSFSTNDSQRTEAEARRTSLPGLDRAGIYSPPARPAFFRPPRDSMLPQPRRSPLASPAMPDSPNADTSAPGRRIRESIASIAGFPTAPKTPKAGPRPLLLSTSSLITGAGPSPSSARFGVASTMAQQESSDLRRKSTLRHRDSQSSVSSIGSVTPFKAGTRSDVESDVTESRRIPLHRGSISPMAPASRIGNSRPTSQSSASDWGTVSPSGGSQTISTREKRDQSSRKGWGRVDVPDSPSTLPSSPPPPTPPSSTFSPRSIAVSSEEYQRGSVVINDADVRALDPLSESRKYARKKTASLNLRLNETSDSPVSADSPAKVSRVRSKRYVNRPTNLRIQKSDSQSSGGAELKTPSPNSLALPEWPEDHDSTTTPRATTFDSTRSESEDDHQLSSGPHASPRSPRRARKISNEARAETSRTRKMSSENRGEAGGRKICGEGHQDGVRLRKVSTDVYSTRSRKVSTDNRDHKRIRDSAAEEGDDEGYDELLSAYESEDSVAHHHSH